MTKGSNPSQQRRERARSAASEIREYGLGNLDVDHQDVSPAAVLVDDPDLQRHLIYQERVYNRRKSPREPEFWALPSVRDRLTPEASRVVTDAVHNGKLSVMEYTTGLPEWDNDVSTLHTIRKLEDWLIYSEQCRLIYMAGIMGRGKTDFSLSMLQVIHWVHERLRQTAEDPSTVQRPEFAANFAVDPEPDDVHCYHISDHDRLIEWAERGSSDEERWFIFDEASTELTAQSGENAQDVAEVFAPFVKKMRKVGVNMIIIGHDGGDVHVAIRSIADYIAKTGTKSASVYGGIKSREPTDHKMDLEHIPETTWGYDTDDTAEWSWGSALDDDGPSIRDTYDPSTQSGNFSADAIREWRNRTIETLHTEYGVSYQQLQDAFGVSSGTVRNAVK